MFEYRPSPKVKHPRNKPTAKQRGAISASTRAELASRSNNLCERCGRGGIALQAAHTVRRWKVEGKTTVNELCHLCIECHTWADSCKDGREWLESFKEKIKP